EREADGLAARALGGERMRAAAPRPSTGPVQGLFEDLTELLAPVVDPVVDAAAEVWHALTDHEHHAGKHSVHVQVGDVLVVKDAHALVRDREAGWAPTGASIPLGTTVLVLEVDGKHARVQGADLTPWGWTSASNLDAGKGKTDPATPEGPV